MSNFSQIGIIFACCCIFPVFIALTCVLLAVPTYLLVIGIVYMDSCPADSRIPVIIICVAAFIIVERMLESTNQVMEQSFLRNHPKPDVHEGQKAREDWEELKKSNQSMALMAVIAISRLAVFVTTIVASVFVFSAYSNRSQCNGLLYYSAFSYCIISLSLSALAIIIVGGICCVFTFFAVRMRSD